ncbi:MAG: DUF86 domain-containing protein [bacterium]
MAEVARHAVAEVARMQLDDLASDHVRALGLVKCLEVIGEAAARLNVDFRSSHPQIPWDQIVGMRNRLVHAYFDIDYEQVWSTLTEDLPPLIRDIGKILENEFPGQSC